MSRLHGLDTHIDDLAFWIANQHRVRLKSVVIRDRVGDPSPSLWLANRAMVTSLSEMYILEGTALLVVA